MAQVQRLLYEQDDITNISVTQCLRALVEGFEPEESPDIPIRLEADVSILEQSPVHISLEYAIPLALIVSELFSNCYLHAFSGKQEGTILLIAGLTQDRCQLELSVIDNGIGIPPPAQRYWGLGLELVDILTAQIQGTFLIERIETGGTRAVLKVPITP